MDSILTHDVYDIHHLKCHMYRFDMRYPEHVAIELCNIEKDRWGIRREYGGKVECKEYQWEDALVKFCDTMVSDLWYLTLIASKEMAIQRARLIYLLEEARKVVQRSGEFGKYGGALEVLRHKLPHIPVSFDVIFCELIRLRNRVDELESQQMRTQCFLGEVAAKVKDKEEEK